jgi:hypothetical protein
MSELVVSVAIDGMNELVVSAQRYGLFSYPEKSAAYLRINQIIHVILPPDFLI